VLAPQVVPARPWPGWLGSVVLLAVTYVPPALATGHLVIGSGHFQLQCGPALAVVPGLALVALIAPLVGYRRRSALVALVPIWGWGRLAAIGYDIATLVRPAAIDTPAAQAVAAR
jgi:hypothetical protein